MCDRATSLGVGFAPDQENKLFFIGPSVKSGKKNYDKKSQKKKKTQY